MSAKNRVAIIDEAKVYVTKDRNTAYGEPEDNFAAIAGIWNAQGVRVKGKLVDPTDVALMMIGMKLGRLKHNTDHRDSWVDIIGYSACGFDTTVTDDGGEGGSLVEEINTNNALSAKNAIAKSVAKLNGSTYACGVENPHAGHAYHRIGDKVFEGGGNWCDGVKPEAGS